jgi:hypothetical protein
VLSAPDPMLMLALHDVGPAWEPSCVRQCLWEGLYEMHQQTAQLTSTSVVKPPHTALSNIVHSILLSHITQPSPRLTQASNPGCGAGSGARMKDFLGQGAPSGQVGSYADQVETRVDPAARTRDPLSHGASTTQGGQYATPVSASAAYAMMTKDSPGRGAPSSQAETYANSMWSMFDFTAWGRPQTSHAG